MIKVYLSFVTLAALIILLGIVGAFIMASFSYLTPSTVYGYNITKNDIAEGRILQLCIDWNIENKICSELYGNINNSNGEPLK